MQPERRYWLIPGTGTVRTKVFGAVMGLIGGLLLGGIVIPSRAVVAPLTGLATAAAAVVTEYWLQRVPHTPVLPLWGAMLGAATGMVAGAIVGLIAALGFAGYLLVTGQPLLPPFALLAETAAISGVANLIVGFSLGLGLLRQ